MDTVLPYLMSVIGFLIVFVLNGIKSEIRDIKAQLSKIESDLNGRITDMDRRREDQYVELERRVSGVEIRCAANHVRSQ